MNRQSILQAVEDGRFPGGVHLFDTIDSTNSWSLAEIRKNRQLPFVCIADHQSKGRGRRGRHWLSPSGANIYMSTAWAFALPADKLMLLSMAQGLAVLRTLKKAGIGDAWLKWPNDVLVADSKIAGVLVETTGAGGQACNAVIGVGLNYNMPGQFVAESGMRWTDMARSTGGAMPDRSTVAAMLINEVANMCVLYQQQTSSIIDDIRNELAALTGRDVVLHFEAGEALTGTVLGISEAGELKVNVDGRERWFNSGDVSLRAFGRDHGRGVRLVDD